MFAFPSPYPRQPMTAWFQHPWAEARGWRMDAEDPVTAERTAVESGVEFHLPAVPVYCAVEVSG